ncbi:DUF2071 domain-containing protein [Glutamicibacter protophormiae]|uniref:YqjF family protein n=1 Tax=Glutamicibacter protophormiae TaxID=37930 RepID=UPI002A81803E|nr:DUF2071 domain-containing protein [Glutamicibacter protophormiae]WPR64698.1 DUF2071 domain-containing protein [Glutamicibacter protophormiae]WPR68194.1 DUF2071 domain-containing protein [Glutamicibacter protophormiae]
MEAVSSVPPQLGAKAIMSQRWSDASFLHWRVSPDQVARYMPEGCVPDIVDGSAWVGLIAFQMSRSAFFGGPPIPWLGDFPEVNVRLYSVDRQGRRSVVFLSLEASHLLPVLCARAVFGLKYQWASMAIERQNGQISYSTRRHGNREARSNLIVEPQSDGIESLPENEQASAIALTARWAFHQRHLGRTLYCRNFHEPWPLRTARLVSLDDQLLAAAGFEGLAAREPDSVLYAHAVDTVFAAPISL